MIPNTLLFLVVTNNPFTVLFFFTTMYTLQSKLSNSPDGVDRLDDILYDISFDISKQLFPDRQDGLKTDEFNLISRAVLLACLDQDPPHLTSSDAELLSKLNSTQLLILSKMVQNVSMMTCMTCIIYLSILVRNYSLSEMMT